MSLPSRERGLKYIIRHTAHLLSLSLPSRERGLKLGELLVNTRLATVAPLAGAWIEILPDTDMEMIRPESLPSRERGLKFLRHCTSLVHRSSLPSRERGLKSSQR